MRTFCKLHLKRICEVVFSYFFASPRLNNIAIQSLARFVRALQDSPRIPTIVMAYINSSDPRANSNYASFKSIMKIDSKAVGLNNGSEYELIYLK